MRPERARARAHTLNPPADVTASKQRVVFPDAGPRNCCEFTCSAAATWHACSTPRAGEKLCQERRFNPIGTARNLAILRKLWSMYALLTDSARAPRFPPPRENHAPPVNKCKLRDRVADGRRSSVLKCRERWMDRGNARGSRGNSVSWEWSKWRAEWYGKNEGRGDVRSDIFKWLLTALDASTRSLLFILRGWKSVNN